MEKIFVFKKLKNWLTGREEPKIINININGTIKIEIDGIQIQKIAERVQAPESRDSGVSDPTDTFKTEQPVKINQDFKLPSVKFGKDVE